MNNYNIPCQCEYATLYPTGDWYCGKDIMPYAKLAIEEEQTECKHRIIGNRQIKSLEMIFKEKRDEEKAQKAQKSPRKSRKRK